MLLSLLPKQGTGQSAYKSNLVTWRMRSLLAILAADPTGEKKGKVCAETVPYLYGYVNMVGIVIYGG